METQAKSFYKSQRNDVLKAIALVTMLIDHVGYLFFEEQSMFRTIGRIAFPIFAYQLAMGFRHTSNRIRYFGRLAIFSVISYFPYIYFRPNLERNPLNFSIMFQLLLGFVMLQVLEWAIGQFKRYQSRKNPLYIVFGVFFILLTVVIVIGPDLLQVMYNRFHFSYGTYGMLLMLLFYLFGHKVFPVLVSYLLVTILTTYMGLADVLYNGVAGPGERLSLYIEALLTRPDDIWHNLIQGRLGRNALSGDLFQLQSILALPLIWNLPKRDIKFKLPTYLAYWFYPVHISILILIKWWILKM